MTNVWGDFFIFFPIVQTNRKETFRLNLDVLDVSIVSETANLQITGIKKNISTVVNICI